MSASPYGPASALVPVEPTGPSIALHPIVPLSISDHCTTNAAGPRLPLDALLGIVTGQRSARTTELSVCFELLPAGDSSTLAAGGAVFDVEHARKRREMLRQVYPSHEVVGWYAVGEALREEQCRAVHALVRQVFEVEDPLVLLLGYRGGARTATTTAASVTDQFPLHVFEMGPPPQCVPRKVRFEVASDESERIGVDALIDVDPARTGAKGGRAEVAGERSGAAANLLAAQVRTARDYVRAVLVGAVEADPQLLRRIMRIAQALPAGRSYAATGAAASDSIDDLVVAYAAAAQSAVTAVAVATQPLSTVVSERASASIRRHPLDF